MTIIPVAIGRFLERRFITSTLVARPSCLSPVTGSGDCANALNWFLEGIVDRYVAPTNSSRSLRQLN